MSTLFTPPDYLRFEDLLTEEERLVRDTVREFVSDRVVPVIGECFREERFPEELIPQIAELGLFGANLEGYGCAGLGAVSYGLACRELERGDSGVRSFISVQSSLAMFAIWRWGSEEQKQRFLPPMARGEKIGCFGLTEPDHGSDPGSLRTRAVRSGDEYVLSGNKMWITNGSIADVAVVWAQVDEDGEDRIRGFIVEKGTPGFSATKQKGKWSLRASVTSELHLDDCRVPATNLLPDGAGLKGPLSCLNSARYGIAWGAIGAAEACYGEALDYATTRVQFGKPIASFQLVQAKLVEMLSGITRNQLIVLRLGRLAEEGKSRPQMISLAKRDAVRMALETARAARDILAANGITDEYQAGRHMMNLETVTTYEGTHDIHSLIIGADITGIPAFHG